MINQVFFSDTERTNNLFLKEKISKINELPDFKQNPTEIFRLLDFNLEKSWLGHIEDIDRFIKTENFAYFESIIKFFKKNTSLKNIFTKKNQNDPIINPTFLKIIEEYDKIFNNNNNNNSIQLYTKQQNIKTTKYKTFYKTTKYTKSRNTKSRNTRSIKKYEINFYKKLFERT